MYNDKTSKFNFKFIQNKRNNEEDNHFNRTKSYEPINLESSESNFNNNNLNFNQIPMPFSTPKANLIKADINLLHKNKKGKAEASFPKLDNLREKIVSDMHTEIITNSETIKIEPPAKDNATKDPKVQLLNVLNHMENMAQELKTTKLLLFEKANLNEEYKKEKENGNRMETKLQEKLDIFSNRINEYIGSLSLSMNEIKEILFEKINTNLQDIQSNNNIINEIIQKIESNFEKNSKQLTLLNEEIKDITDKQSISSIKDKIVEDNKFVRELINNESKKIEDTLNSGLNTVENKIKEDENFKIKVTSFITKIEEELLKDRNQMSDKILSLNEKEVKWKEQYIKLTSQNQKLQNSIKKTEDDYQNSLKKNYELEKYIASIKENSEKKIKEIEKELKEKNRNEAYFLIELSNLLSEKSINFEHLLKNENMDLARKSLISDVITKYKQDQKEEKEKEKEKEKEVILTSNKSESKDESVFDNPNIEIREFPDQENIDKDEKNLKKSTSKNRRGRKRN
ncbi:hypothetical protein K502DRAFT_349247 [Neoconidiobolus thromboides FSU 785]|nr:hypothetical protein K502DRAFT_349247 [Neoconidiobolus thromboides FSU 785]